MVEVGAGLFSAAASDYVQELFAPRRCRLSWPECASPIGRALVGMIIAELFTAITGLGAMLSLYGNIFETAKMFVVIIVLALLGFGLIQATSALESKLANWKETERAL